MKKSFYLGFPAVMLAAACYTAQPCQAQLWKRVKNAVSQTASDRAVNDASNETNKAIDKAEHPGSGQGQTGDGGNSADNAGQPETTGGQVSVSPTPAVPTLKTYENYDFVPGDSIILFEDFSGDQVGELPAHWLLCYGQGEVTSFDGKKVFALTYGEHGDAAVVLQPRMKTVTGYMPRAFTVEFDMYVSWDAKAGGDVRDGWVGLTFYGDNNPIDDYDDWDLSPGALGFYSHDLYDGSRDLPENLKDQHFVNRWHHVAIAYRDRQMKIYLDQNRLYVIPQVKDSNINKFGIRVSGKCVVTDIRVASGGGMTMLNKKLIESKIVTHGIHFDVDKAVIEPESMGTLNMIAGILKSNAGIKFEIDGHTDNTGDAAHNLELSQQRAEAVKSQLVTMGIDASRLTAKGYGDTRPIADNSTPEGRANNRRVEFLKMP